MKTLFENTKHGQLTSKQVHTMILKLFIDCASHPVKYEVKDKEDWDGYIIKCSTYDMKDLLAICEVFGARATAVVYSHMGFEHDDETGRDYVSIGLIG